ncbi:hypothetical protein [Catellatospora methionotrophica]|uniref:hypothetical protein n=1 Tax=Catellatospora methionotrophica TaxID=121620 RepID=UPI0033E2969E
MTGLALVVVAVVLQAAGNGLLSENLSGTESLLLSFLAFGIATVVFLGVDRWRTRDAAPGGRRLPPGAGRALVLLNVATAVTFLSFFWSLSLIPAPLAVAVEASIGPLILTGVRWRTLAGAQRTGQLLLGGVTVALAVAAANRIIVDSTTAVGTQLFGVAVAAVAGASAAGIAVLSYRLGELRVSPARVTAHRFHLTYAAAAVLLAVTSGWSTVDALGGRAGFLLLVATLGTALPLFILQAGLQTTPPMKASLVVSALPGLTYLAASAAGRQGFDAITFVLIGGSIVLAFAGPALISMLERRTAAEVSA